VLAQFHADPRKRQAPNVRADEGVEIEAPKRHSCDITVFIGRLLPVIRTFIAFPAGVARMPLWRFNLYTFVGSYIWSLALAWVGMKLGEHWDTLGVYFHRFDAAIAIVGLAAVAWYIWRHVRQIRR